MSAVSVLRTVVAAGLCLALRPVLAHARPMAIAPTVEREGWLGRWISGGDGREGNQRDGQHDAEPAPSVRG